MKNSQNQGPDEVLSKLNSGGDKFIIIHDNSMEHSMDSPEKRFKARWFKIATTNKNPLDIANFYLNCMKSYMIAPRLLRMDKGTENSASIRNQQIKVFWPCLKTFSLSWWKTFFQQMFHDGIHWDWITWNIPVIKKELNNVVQTWNARPSSARGGKSF